MILRKIIVLESINFLKRLFKSRHGKFLLSTTLVTKTVQNRHQKCLRTDVESSFCSSAYNTLINTKHNNPFTSPSLNKGKQHQEQA